MTADARTIAVYDAQAATYDDRFRVAKPGRYLREFMELLPRGARVLDLGCGPGNASAFLRDAGHLPDPVDASPRMVALANDRHRIGARLGTFDDIDALAAYDGVWANFSLLHAPRADLPRHIGALHRALRPGGVIHIGMKTGTGEARDGLDRLYTYVSPEELAELLAEAGFALTHRSEGTEVGLAGTSDPFVVMRAYG